MRCTRCDIVTIGFGNEESASDDIPQDAKEPLIQFDCYSTRKQNYFHGKPIYEQEIELKEVKI